MNAPRMTRAHFRFLAAVIAEARRWASTPEERDAWHLVTQMMSDALAQTNPNYDRARFMDAAKGERTT